MDMRKHNKMTVLLVAFYALASTALKAQEIAPLPTALTADRLQRIASLSPYAQHAAPGPSHTLSQTAGSMKDSVATFRRQGIWPVRVATRGGTEYWGEITTVGANTFELLNLKTNEKATLDYATIRSIAIVKFLPSVKPPWAKMTRSQRTGEVVSIILLMPVRILEELFIPRC
jgi:hypothetical protein